MYHRAWDANEKRRKRNALVKGMVDGNPPYDQAKLDANAQRYRANFNNGEAESFLNTAVTAFYDLFSEVETFANCSVDTDSIDGKVYSDVVTEEFDWLLRQNDRFDYSIQLSIHDMVLYGSGPQTWDDPIDWRSRYISHNEVLLPDNSASNVVDFERVFFKADFRVDQLYRFISDEEAAKKGGWNVAAVKKAIIRAAEVAKKPFNNHGDWTEYQRWIRSNDMAVGDECDVVRCARCLYREFPKNGNESTVSEAWVWLDGTGDDEFLYQEIDSYSDWRHALAMFFYDRGDGKAHNVRGLGVKMFNLLLAKMRLQNATVDAAFARAAVMLRALGSHSTTQQSLAVTHVGPYTVLPHGFEFVPVAGAGVIDAPLAVSRDLDGTLAANLGQYRARLEKPEGNPRTAFEVNAEIQKQSILGKTQIARFYQQLDEYFAEVFRRASNPDIPKTTKNKYLQLALEFQSRCKKRGVTGELLRKCKVMARRTVGQGSAYMRILSLQQILNTVFPLLPEDGKYALVDDIIAAQAGRTQVARYNPQPVMRTKEAQQRWEAQIENDTLKNRGQVTLTPYQNDVIHAQEHLAFGSQAAQSLQGGADPFEILGILQATGQHLAMHMQRLAGNTARQTEYKLLSKQFAELGKVVDQLEKQLQQQQEQQMEQQQMAAQAQQMQAGMDPEMQMKSAETAHKMQLQTAKTQHQMALRKAKQDADIALKDALTAAEIQRRTLEATVDRRMKQREAEEQE